MSSLYDPNPLYGSYLYGQGPQPTVYEPAWSDAYKRKQRMAQQVAPQQNAGLFGGLQGLLGGQRQNGYGNPFAAMMMALGGDIAANRPGANASMIPQLMAAGQQKQQAQLARQQKEGEEKQKRNATIEYLKAKGRTDLIGLVDSGAIDASTAMRAASEGKSVADVSLNPIPIRDPEGRLHMGQPLKSNGEGGLYIDGKKYPGIPEGWQWDVRPQAIKPLDTGPTFTPFDPATGRTHGEAIKKDLRGAEREKQIGKGEGETFNSLVSLRSKIPALQQTVGELKQLANKATYTATGRLVNEVIKQTGQEPREAAVARTEYIAKVDNQVLPLLRDTFGAQFTEREGATLRATLGDPNMSPAEKQAVLESFITQKLRDLNALEIQANPQATIPGQSPAARPGQRKTSSGVTWSVE